MICATLLLAATTASALPATRPDLPPATPTEVEAPPPITTKPLRNPFWPVDKFNDYINESEAITSEPIVKAAPEEKVVEKPATAAEAAEVVAAERQKAEKAQKKKDKNVVSRQSWARAAATGLKITGVTTYTDKETGEKKTAYRINGRVYTYGDNISVDSDGHRFTWRINPGPSPRKPRFEQLRVKPLPASTEPSTEGKK